MATADWVVGEYAGRWCTKRFVPSDSEGGTEGVEEGKAERRRRASLQPPFFRGTGEHVPPAPFFKPSDTIHFHVLLAKGSKVAHCLVVQPRGNLLPSFHRPTRTSCLKVTRVTKTKKKKKKESNQMHGFTCEEVLSVFVHLNLSVLLRFLLPTSFLQAECHTNASPPFHSYIKLSCPSILVLRPFHPPFPSPLSSTD